MRTALLWIAALAAAIALDHPLASYLAAHPLSYSFELYSLFRLGGYLPFWIVVSLALVLVDAERGWRGAWPRGGWLLAAVVASGALAELLKLTVRRERPDADVPFYVFRPWVDAELSTSGIGWPSSHTAVAFGAAWWLCRLYPRGSALWIAIGAACGFSRLWRNAHFASDVVGAALVAYLVVAALWRVRERLRAQPA
jgi:membrane-associated phospholipid phosphatase